MNGGMRYGRGYDLYHETPITLKHILFNDRQMVSEGRK